MPKKMLLMEEFHLSVFVPRNLPKSVYDDIHRTLRERRFRTRLRDAVRAVFGRRSSLKKTHIRISH